MFLGSLPNKCIEQIFRVVPFEDWRSVHVCCSGSFKIEQAIQRQYPDTGIYSNDVSIWTTAIAQAALRAPFRLVFRNRLEFVNDYLEGQSVTTHAAAVMLAHEMSRYASTGNEYAKKHFAYYCENFAGFLEQAEGKLSKFVEGLNINSYYCGDWLTHLDSAIERGSGVFTFPPTYKGGYEQLYKFLDDSVDWDKPKYDVFDPAQLNDILTRVKDADVPYVFVADQLLPDHTPTLEFTFGRQKPLYGYNYTPKSSVRHINSPSENSASFLYTPIDTSKLTHRSRVEIVLAKAQHANFIKDIYLSKAINRTNGMFSLFILVDGMLAGCLTYRWTTKNRKGGGTPVKGISQNNVLYLLSDVCLSQENKLSKLIASIATSKELINIAEKKLFLSIKELRTTAFSEHPVSMKYRGIFELRERKDNPNGGYSLEYASEIRNQSPQKMYEKWFKKYGSK